MLDPGQDKGTDFIEILCLCILGRVFRFFLLIKTPIMTEMITVTITREMRMIERVDRGFTTNES